jgi:hypothetical protein
MDKNHNAHNEEFDSEIEYGTIVQWMVGFSVVMVIIMIAMYGMYRFMVNWEISNNPTPHPLAAQRREQPPLPRLQELPTKDIEQMRRQDAAVLAGKEKATKSIDEAMKAVLANGLSSRTAEDAKDLQDLGASMPSDGSAGRTSERRWPLAKDDTSTK